MKNIIAVFLSVLVALGISLGNSFALAEEEGHENTPGEFDVTCQASPRFPIANEEAELTCTVLHNGTHEEGLTVTLLFTRTEVDHGDDHGDAAADDHDDAEADHDDAEADHDDAEADHDDAEADHDDAAADDHGDAAADDHDDAAADDHDDAAADHDDAEADHDDAESTDTESVNVVAVETMAGVYVAKYTFEQEGKYLGVAQIGEEQTDFTVAVRGKPVAWSFIAGLFGITILVAGIVAIIKTVRKDW